MAAVPAQLDAKAARSTQRGAARRKLRLPAQGAARSAAANVLILDVSTTGLLLETASDLAKGETIEVDIPEAAGTRAVVKWTSGRLFGCEFAKPISPAAVSAALLRAPYDARDNASSTATADARHPLGERALGPRLSPGARLRWIVGLAILSWAIVAAAVSIAWRFLF